MGLPLQPTQSMILSVITTTNEKEIGQRGGKGARILEYKRQSRCLHLTNVIAVIDSITQIQHFAGVNISFNVRSVRIINNWY